MVSSSSQRRPYCAEPSIVPNVVATVVSLTMSFSIAGCVAPNRNANAVPIVMTDGEEVRIVTPVDGSLFFDFDVEKVYRATKRGDGYVISVPGGGAWIAIENTPSQVEPLLSKLATLGFREGPIKGNWYSIKRVTSEGLFARKEFLILKLHGTYQDAELWSAVADFLMPSELVLNRVEIPVRIAMITGRVVSDVGYSRAPVAKIGRIESKGRTALPFDRIFALLQSYFKGKGTQSIEKKGDGSILLRVDGMKGEILKSKSYWESITLQAVFVAGPSTDRWTLFLAFDGSYTAQLGEPPPASRYSNMQPEYTNEIQLFLDYLTGRLQGDMLGAGSPQ